jgi:hypothetical protein
MTINQFVPPPKPVPTFEWPFLVGNSKTGASVSRKSRNSADVTGAFGVGARPGRAPIRVEKAPKSLIGPTC